MPRDTIVEAAQGQPTTNSGARREERRRHSHRAEHGSARHERRLAVVVRPVVFCWKRDRPRPGGSPANDSASPPTPHRGGVAEYKERLRLPERVAARGAVGAPRAEKPVVV